MPLQIDYEHEHRFTEHEHDVHFVPERYGLPGGGECRDFKTAVPPPLRYNRWLSVLSTGIDRVLGSGFQVAKV
ncbi:hypothetical protein [Rubripirellula reticaptiva]|uniref:Uncharacterized protein n=1 Tax=Rubripirellula reticaptiva TaxID=2528013 RepID=A0A5C6EWC0_9BACT|nr:hypothetical protein [Rubripirellula reticaptiva]TWU51531.1 hypothetical protein Poly59_31230 [Rubripirellula reticaptiva]